MALIQQQQMTEANLEAHRRNGRKSRGAATPEGKERSRAANLRHGYYSKIRDEALTALGEDPADLAGLIEGAHEQFRPANTYQAWIVEHMARLQWRIQRAGRQQESLASEHVARIEQTRREKALELRIHYVDMLDFLQMLLDDAARPDFYAPPGYFRRLSETFARHGTRPLEDIPLLLHRLRKPKNFPPAGPLPATATADDEWAEQVADMEPDNFPIPQPHLPVAEGVERDELREELREAVEQELTTFNAGWEPTLKKNAKPLSTAQRDELAADVNPQIELMRRQEDSCFRQFWRLGNYLMKIQEAEKREPEKQYSGVGSQESEGRDRVCSIQDSEDQGSGADGQAAEAAARKNEGASGYVQENTGKAKSEVTMDCPAPGGQDLEPLTPQSDDPSRLDVIPGAMANETPNIGEFA